ncbi:MAG TPA: FAD-dependent oxidoreductase [Solirubrobacteraceae bacterium]|jgi:glycine/D-amino acid oxidase-like deaminating enzyme/nitrite reductase/ring-hydroxylating ferredoxin subunit
MTPPRATDSLWIDQASSTSYPSLERDLEVDVAVIGGGIAGVTTALFCKQDGLRVAVLEKGVVSGAATGMSTAKASALQKSVLSEVRKVAGKDALIAYAQSNAAALERMDALVREHSIDCSWERVPDYTYAGDEAQVSTIEQIVEAGKEAGLPVERTTDVPLPFDVPAAARLDGQAQFQPATYTRALAALVDGDGSSVFESTMVTGVSEGSPHEVHVEGDVTVRARHVVVATQYPLLDRGVFFARLEATRSYIVAGKGSGPDAMLITAGQPTRSVRRWGDWLLVGGEGHQTGASKAEPERYEQLMEFGRRHFGMTDFPYRWSTQDGMPVDHLPYIGRYHPRAEGLWVAGGFQKWGMTNGTVAAMVISDLIAGRDNPYAAELDPNRARVRAAPKLAQINMLVGLHFVGDRLSPAEARSADDVPPGEARVVRSGLGKIGVYRDEEGGLHSVSLRCTHLGCLTKWNDAERSWDCPCHGSRFDPDGNVLAGPAVRPLERRD